MISGSTLLVLLGLISIQSFTTAHKQNEPITCCWDYQRNKIPVRMITTYKVTELQCTKPGVIFTLKRDGRRVCADPGVEWVQSHMGIIDQHEFNNMNRNRTNA